MICVYIYIYIYIYIFEAAGFLFRAPANNPMSQTYAKRYCVICATQVLAVSSIPSLSGGTSAKSLEHICLRKRLEQVTGGSDNNYDMLC